MPDFHHWAMWFWPCVCLRRNDFEIFRTLQRRKLEKTGLSCCVRFIFILKICRVLMVWKQDVLYGGQMVSPSEIPLVIPMESVQSHTNCKRLGKKNLWFSHTWMCQTRTRQDSVVDGIKVERERGVRQGHLVEKTPATAASGARGVWVRAGVRYGVMGRGGGKEALLAGERHPEHHSSFQGCLWTLWAPWSVTFWSWFVRIVFFGPVY